MTQEKINISIRQGSVCLSVCLSVCVCPFALYLAAHDYFLTSTYSTSSQTYSTYCTILTIISAGQNTTCKYVRRPNVLSSSTGQTRSTYRIFGYSRQRTVDYVVFIFFLRAHRRLYFARSLRWAALFF